MAGILSALRITSTSLDQQRVLFQGAGSAARGIADQIVAGMRDAGLSLEAARSRVWMVDSQGLVIRDRLKSLAEHKRDFAHPGPPLKRLEEIVRWVRPTILIGVSGQPGAFSESVVRTLCQQVERPILLPLSNPTSKAECTAEQAYRRSEGKALFASGSPFPPVDYRGKRFVPGQGNNLYIFPGVGLGAVLCRAKRITDRMFYAAARTLADQVSEDSLAMGSLYPDLGLIREISAQIAAAVWQVAAEEGVAQIEPPADLLGQIKRHQYYPRYLPYEAA